MNLKRIFCTHIWKGKAPVYLRTEKKPDGGQKWGIYTYSYFNYYAVELECLKCGKRRRIEKREQII